MTVKVMLFPDTYTEPVKELGFDFHSLLNNLNCEAVYRKSSVEELAKLQINLINLETYIEARYISLEHYSKPMDEREVKMYIQIGTDPVKVLENRIKDATKELQESKQEYLAVKQKYEKLESRIRFTYSNKI